MKDNKFISKKNKKTRISEIFWSLKIKKEMETERKETNLYL
jgi:hypothetical protein